MCVCVCVRVCVWNCDSECEKECERAFYHMYLGESARKNKCVCEFVYVCERERESKKKTI